MVLAKNGLRLIAVGALALGAAVSANAWIITMAGTNAGSILTVNYKFSDLIGNTFTPSVLGGFGSGSLQFVSGGQSLLVDYIGTSVSAGGTTSFDGTWSEVSQTGLPNVLPHGTYSASIDNAYTKGDWEWSFVGTTTPEPAPLAVIGLGIIGLIARRRKKS